MQQIYEEIELNPQGGMGILLLNTLLIIGAIVVFIFGIIHLNALMIIAGAVYGFVIGPIIFIGLKIVKPNEALVLALFGKYTGTIKREGFFFVNPFSTAVNPAKGTVIETLEQKPSLTQTGVNVDLSRKISLKTMTFSNNPQKINDQLGNPIIISINVTWRVINTAKAVFSVDNYKEYLSIQCDSSLRNIVRLYPYDAYGNDSEKSLRGSSQEIACNLKEEIQSKVDAAGLEIVEAQITHLAYAPEIAATMLQRQQAKATIDAKQMIVDASVGMVELALERLTENDVVHFDEERKAAMISNLLVVLCSSRDAQPVVNTGSIYNV